MTHLVIQHSSLQFSIGPRKKAVDARRIFSREPDLLSGTESRGNMPRELRVNARLAGYILNAPRKTAGWVAVKAANVVPGTVTQGYVPLFPGGSDRWGKWGNRGIVWIQFKHKTLGWVTYCTAHYFTHGKNSKMPRWAKNRRYAREIAKFFRAHARGGKIAFIGMDSNMEDKVRDIFFGAPLTTCWDELKKWPSTTPDGANIDVIASWDRDTRVKCVGAKVLNDKVFPLNVDHYTVEATYEVLPLK